MACVISRDEFLTGRVMALQKKESHHGLRMWTVSNEVLSPVLGFSPAPSPPPGLELRTELEPPGLELPDAATLTAAQPVATVPEPEQHKVLLQNLPEAMLKECMLRVMLEQAGIKNITGLNIRKNGKALITFPTISSVRQCINHCQGRKWGGSLVSALYVRTVQTTPTPEEPPTKKRMSADAPVFVMPSDTKICVRDRVSSNASTDVGADDASNGCDSETETIAVCT